MYHSLDVTFFEHVPHYVVASPHPSETPSADFVDLLPSPSETPLADSDNLLRPIPLFEPVSVPPSATPIDKACLPPVVTTPPARHYVYRPRAPAPLPASSLESDTTAPPLRTSPAPRTPRYPARDRRAPVRFGFSCSTNHPISQYVSYSGLSYSYLAILGRVDSVSIPRSVSETLESRLGVHHEGGNRCFGA